MNATSNLAYIAIAEDSCTYTCLYMYIVCVQLVDLIQRTFHHLPRSNVSGATVMGVVGDSIANRPSVSSSFTVLKKES